MMTFTANDIRDVRGHLNDAEAALLHRLASEVKPGGVIVELGSYQGKSTICLGMGAKAAGAAVYAIDSFNDLSGHMSTGLSDRDMLVVNLAHFGLTDTVTVITGESLAQAKRWDKRKPIDLMFIDASHNYEDVKADFEAWSPRVTGCMAFHDTSGNWPGVTKFMSEVILAGEWEVIEFADSTSVLRRRASE